ncbi:MAG: hypothetical protein KGN39_04300 [Betaproteobacteria bacterium]|nr:hypothetical protein [Betaproteobacteria bacterium]
MEAISKATLLDVHFEKVIAELGPGSDLPRGGKIETEVSTSALNEKNSENRAVVKVELKAIAVSSEAKTDDEFSYRIIVECVGLYDWSSLDKRPDLNDEPTTRALSAPLYVLATEEAKYLVRRMNMGNLNLPWDLSSIENDEVAEKKQLKKTPTPSKRATKKR